MDTAGIPYAVVGGNAVALWVARFDPAATRTTKDVDLLIKRSDLEHVTRILCDLGLLRQDLRSPVLFVDPEEPSRRSGVHLVWSDEKVRPSYSYPAPSLDEAVRGPEGFLVLDLPALMRMKLTSLCSIDRVHVQDLLQVGAVDDRVRNALPTDLRARLEEIARNLEDES